MARRSIHLMPAVERVERGDAIGDERATNPGAGWVDFAGV
jgi:hypothetical protein